MSMTLSPLKLPSIWFLCAVVLACPGSTRADNDPAPPRESEPGSADTSDVTPSGTFSYSRPISIPRARGPVPRLALSYNSSLGNGLAGYGWVLTGFPAIARIRGDNGMNFSGADTFAFLPGGWGTSFTADNILKQASDKNWYLTKNLTSPIWQFRASVFLAGDGPLYWTMRDGKGTTYYFGG